MRTRIISTRMYGAPDYIGAALLPMVPRVFGWDRRLTRRYEASPQRRRGVADHPQEPPGRPGARHRNAGWVAFLEALRADATMESTPVVVATAATDENVSRRVAELNAVGYRVKGHCSLQQVFALVTTHARRGTPAA